MKSVGVGFRVFILIGLLVEAACLGVLSSQPRVDIHAWLVLESVGSLKVLKSLGVYQ